jgi:hypothetical protein
LHNSAGLTLSGEWSTSAERDIKIDSAIELGGYPYVHRIGNILFFFDTKLVM